MKTENERLSRKVALITGAGSGIAKAAANLFAREGAQVTIAEIDRETGRATEQAVRAAGGSAMFIPTDVTDDESVRRAITRTVENYGALHILYNCAGGSLPNDGPVTGVEMTVWEHTISLDLKGPFLCCRYAIPEIIKSGGGSVINMGSFVALVGFVPLHVYTAAKGGVISLTRSLAASYAGRGVRVNAICPGAVMTERIKARGGLPNDQPRWIDHPFAFGQPEDVARIALFLASDESRMITGAIIPADGGLSAY